MDRNTIVVLSFGGLCCCLLGWISARAYFSDFLVTETMLGALIGGFIAGIFGLLAAAYSTFQAKAESARRDEKESEVLLHSILAKLIDLNDILQKNRRHFMSVDTATKVVFDSDVGARNFSKPLEGHTEIPTFSIDERTFVLREIGAKCFNKLNDMVGSAQSFSFIHKRHVNAYYELMDEVFGSERTRDGYLLNGRVDPNSMRLMAMMDVDGLLRSLLERAPESAENFLKEVIEISNQKTGRLIRYQTTEVEPSAENDLRSDY